MRTTKKSEIEKANSSTEETNLEVKKVRENTVKTVVKDEEVTKEMVEKWKAEHGKIFKSVIDGQTYVWRQIKRKEYVTIMSNESEEDSVSERVFERQELMTLTVVLYPANIQEHIERAAGLATILAEEIVLKSGFSFDVTTKEL
jgi:hypothetical protein